MGVRGLLTLPMVFWCRGKVLNDTWVATLDHESGFERLSASPPTTRHPDYNRHHNDDGRPRPMSSKPPLSGT